MTPADTARMLLNSRSGRIKDPTADVLLDLWCEHGRQIPPSVRRRGYQVWRRFAATGRSPWLDDDPLLLRWPFPYPPGYVCVRASREWGWAGGDIPLPVFQVDSESLTLARAQRDSHAVTLPKQVIPQNVLSTALTLAKQQEMDTDADAGIVAPQGKARGKTLVRVLGNDESVERERRTAVLAWFFTDYLPVIFEVIGEKGAYVRFLEKVRTHTSRVPNSENPVYETSAFVFYFRNFLADFCEQRAEAQRSAYLAGNRKIQHPSVLKWMELLPWVALRLIYPTSQESERAEGVRRWLPVLLDEVIRKLLPDAPWNYRVKNDVALARDVVNRFQAPLEKGLHDILVGWYKETLNRHS